MLSQDSTPGTWGSPGSPHSKACSFSGGPHFRDIPAVSPRSSLTVASMAPIVPAGEPASTLPAGPCSPRRGPSQAYCSALDSRSPSPQSVVAGRAVTHCFPALHLERSPLAWAGSRPFSAPPAQHTMGRGSGLTELLSGSESCQPSLAQARVISRSLASQTFIQDSHAHIRRPWGQSSDLPCQGPPTPTLRGIHA